ncbi:MAG TPA: NADPH-dependent FMN reductase [Stellaceae bacterium]|nr:NADPH-dependent FMN reductase [Stellaceae bacterium]
MPDATKLLIIVGAATPPGRLAAAMAVAAEAATAAGAAVDILNLAETRAEICDGRPLDAYDSATRDAVARVGAAQAVLIAAPVYRASIPGVLKNLLDIVPVDGLQAKPVGVVAMGGSPHHYLAVDGHMRLVLAWFGALVAPTCVYLTGGDFKDGQLASETARKDLASLTGTLLVLAQRLDPASLSPTPLAARYT